MLGGGYDGFDQLMASVRRRQYRKRRLQSSLLCLAVNPLTGPRTYSSSTLQPSGGTDPLLLQVKRRP